MATQKPNYIIDVGRLKQKLYSLYPSGSPQRDAWIQAERDYSYKRALQAYRILSSSDVTDFLQKNNFYTKIQGLLLFGLLLFSWVFLNHLRGDNLLVEIGALSLLGGLCIYLGVKIYRGTSAYLTFREKLAQVKRQLDLNQKQSQKLLS